MNKIFILLFAVIFSACVQKANIVVPELASPQMEFENNGLFGDPPSIIDAEELFSLDEAQVADILQYIDAPMHQYVPMHQRVYDYLEQSTMQFSYLGKTHTARDALVRDEGNCLSLAILTTALAQLSNVDIGYQLIDSSPVFQQGKNVVSRGVHIRSKLYEQQKSDPEAFSFTKSGLIVDYFPSGTKRFLGNVSKQDFIARYYRNLAVEFLQNKNYSDSYWHVKKSFEYAPADPEGINLMAIIYSRLGNEQKAEEIYLYGIENSNNKLSLLKNYQQLLERQHRYADSKKIRNDITSYDDTSPFGWLSLADAALKNGDPDEAHWYYKKAIELAPYLQYGYLGLAKVYLKQGNIDRTKSLLLQARERNYDLENDGLYAAKLSALARYQRHAE